MRVFLVTTSLVAAAGLAASLRAQGPTDRAGEVFAAESSFAQSMVDRDFEAFASHVSEEAVFFGAGSVQRGKAAVLAAWRPFFTAPHAPFSWSPATVEVLESGTLARSSGPVRDSSGQPVATFNSVWRLEADGRWRVIFDKGCQACAATQETDAVAEVRALIDRVFAGMHEADSAKVRAAFADGARFAVLAEQDTAIRYLPIEGWLRAIASSGGRWEERIYNVRILVDGAMATAWTPYTFLLDGAVRHCGVNAIQLLRTSGGWKITQLSDTRRRESCPTAP